MPQIGLIIDAGASQHLCGNRTEFSTYVLVSEGRGIVMGTIMLDQKFWVCSSTIYARAWAKFSARS